MLTKAAKNELVEQFNSVFKTSPSVMVIEYKGLTVKDMEGLRSNLKKADAELKVVKNSLLKIAAKDTEVEKIDELFLGPTAVAICESDAAAVAKVFVESIKKLPQLKIKGAIVEGSVLDEAKISELSKLPTRDELFAQLLGLLSTPVSNFLGTLTQMQSKLLYALSAVKETKEEVKETKEEAKETKEEAKETKEEAKETKEEAKETKEEAKETKEEAKEAKEEVKETKEEAKGTEEEVKEAKEKEES